MFYRVSTVLGGSQVEGGGITHFAFDISETTPQDAADAVIAFWSAIDTAMSTSVSWEVLDQVAMVNESNGQTSVVVNVNGDSGSGGASGTPLAKATQGVVQWFGSDWVAGRQVRGRTFIPGPTTNHLANGAPAGPYRTALQSAAEGLLAADQGLVVYSPTHGSLSAVQAVGTSSKFGVLRSRRD